jgi:hypothetical protein
VYSLDFHGTKNSNGLLSSSNDGRICQWSLDMFKYKSTLFIDYLVTLSQLLTYNSKTSKWTSPPWSEKKETWMVFWSEPNQARSTNCNYTQSTLYNPKYLESRQNTKDLRSPHSTGLFSVPEPFPVRQPKIYLWTITQFLFWLVDLSVEPLSVHWTYCPVWVLGRLYFWRQMASLGTHFLRLLWWRWDHWHMGTEQLRRT